MIQFEYYSFNKRKYCFLDIRGELNKKFILPNCDDLFLSKYNIMIEVNKPEDYFLDQRFSKLNKTTSKSQSCISKIISSNKIDILFKYRSKEFSLKSYLPFWGKTLESDCWVCIISQKIV